MKLYLGLVHHPIKNKRGEIVTTSVTNLDIHDISRSCRTYGVNKYFVITPLKAQHELLDKILGHWQQPEASAYNPDRFEALSRIQVEHTIDSAIEAITEIEGERPKLAVTGAQMLEAQGDIDYLVQQVNLDKTPLFLLFGTGWGLTASVIERADYRLSPLSGPIDDDYNHLSVRSAVAIYLDRIARERKPLRPVTLPSS